MSNYLKRLSRSVNRSAIMKRHALHLIWAFMKYRCKDCGHELNMYLEEGLEQDGPNHKPVPFGIICPRCGGFHCYDVTGLIPLPGGSRPLNANEHYFKFTLKDDCGIPVHPEEVKRE